jgi:hypothetical protein
MQISTAVTRLIILLSMALLGACGGSGGGLTDTGTAVEPEEGVVFIGLTDAEGDFARYAVDVRSLRLERANGTLVETLPLATRVDFAELTEVTEFVSIATVPAGVYVGASITLDFGAADIIVQAPDGTTSPASVVDPDGNAIGEYELRLSLASRDQFRIAPGVPAAFSLDFDLEASNEIDFGPAVPVVTVEPFLLAVPALETDRAHRVRGVLASVDEANASVTLTVRPFRRRQGDFGQFTFAVADDTEYEVDGIGYTGADGLAALAALPERTPVVAQGDVDSRTLTAATVLAGSSVPWADGDVVRGVVAAREGDTLTVRGASVEFSDGTDVFRGEYEVLIGPQTQVTALGADGLTSDSISVGQRIVAFGELLDEGSFDSRDGRVRMSMNQLTADVVQAQPLAVNLYFLNGRRPAVYDFSGTGVSASLDADPDFYEIDTGALTLDGIETGDLVRVRGLVNAFGAAPADLLARTVVQPALDGRAGQLQVAWTGEQGASMPFLSTSETAIEVDISASREFLYVRGVPRPFVNPLDALSLLAPADGTGAYAIRVRGSGQVTLYRNFADLVDGLNAELDAGSALRRIHAAVAYNDESSALTMVRGGFVFEAPAAN